MLKQFVLNELWKPKTKLCEIMNKEGSDKAREKYHNYTTVYNYLFQNIRFDKLNFLEVGLGTNNINVPSNMGANGTPKASMRGWRTFFPNADLHGADIDKGILIDEERIKTHYINQLDLNTITNFKNEFPISYKFDIIIDDGLHSFEANYNLFNYLNDMVRVGGFYIIEDCNVEDYNKLLVKLDVSNYEVDNIQLPHYNKHDNRMIILKKIKDKVSFENELTIEYLSKIKENDFTKFFEYDKYKINHNKQKVFSMSLFNQKVDLDYPEDQNNEYWKNKYFYPLLKLIPLINKTGYGINLFCEERYKDEIDNPNVNIYTFKHSVGAIGMYWRFLSFDMVDETIICDIDLDNIEIHKLLIKQEFSCRHLASGKNDFYVDKEKTAKKYTSILGSQNKFFKKDFDFNVKDIMIKFLNHQKYYQNNERRNIYNKSVGHMVKGFGNNPLNYGSDERFLAKVIYFYLVKKSKFLTIYENHNVYENKEDVDYTMRNGNKLMLLN
jgi:hypothetical protein